MPSVALRITVHGPHGSIGVGDLGGVLGRIQSLTDAVAKLREDEAATWRIADLKTGSAEVLAELDIPGDARGLAETIVGGVAALHEHSEIPAGYDARALKALAGMGKVVRRHPTRLVVLNGGLHQEAVINESVAVHAREAGRARHTSLGGFSGDIRLLDFRRKRLRFGLLEEFGGRWIPCEAASPEIEDRARDIQNKTRVHVWGRITENAARQPLRITVDDIELFPWAPVDVGQLLGAAKGAEGGRTASEIIREMRETW